jgi:hypothetical protein
MVDYRRWTKDDKTWIVQGNDSCCFVYAVVNCLIARGLSPPTEAMLEKAFDIACCRIGSTIAPEKVVAFFEAPLIKTEYPEEVFQQGGILQIWHPIFNGHSFYLDQECKDEGGLRLINSFLGAPVALNVGKSEIRPWATNRCGPHWKIQPTDIGKDDHEFEDDPHTLDCRICGEGTQHYLHGDRDAD